MRKPIVIFLLLFSLQFTQAQAIVDIDGLVSISFYERTVETFIHTFDIQSKELTVRLNDPLQFGNYDFQGANGEYFDVFYSDEAGNFDANGNYISVEAVWNKTTGGGGLNLVGITLNFDDGSTVFTNQLTSFFANGSNYAEGSETNAVDCSFDTWTTLGNNVNTNQRLRITVGVERVYARFDYEACQGEDYSISVNNTIYNESNPKGRELIPNSNGCDSVVFINLIFTEAVTTDFDYQGCRNDGFSQVINGNTYDETNPSGTEVLTSSGGCDSIVNINLSFAEAVTTRFDYQGCLDDGFSRIINSNTYDENNPSGTETLISSNGCDSVVNINLVFEDCLAGLRDCELFVPNAFSPNQDGINDCFSIYPNPVCQLSAFSIQVFDRWGTLVFSSNDPNFCWDGHLNKGPASAGTYIWSLKYTISGQINRQQSGNLTLVN
jgi:gliding motility-associated-like protein